MRGSADETHLRATSNPIQPTASLFLETAQRSNRMNAPFLRASQVLSRFAVHDLTRDATI
jgi:hypothetical protein